MLVNCTCGAKLKATPELAGKRVKCPACGRAVSIPRPASHDDPLEIEDLGKDPLGLGNSATANPRAVRTQPPTSVPRQPPGPSADTKILMSSPRRLRLIAGWIAVCFGGYQAVVCSVLMLRQLVLVVRSGSLGVTTLAGALGFNALFVALGIWLCKSGVDIVRNEKPRESLERAAQASMVYIALFILGVFLTIFSLIRLIGAPAPLAGIVFAIAIGSMLLRMLYVIPPAIILYIDHRLK